MDHMKTCVIILILSGVFLAGCISSSGSNPAPTGPKVVAVVACPTPIPTDPPEPTVGPTWTPTPTPVPPDLTLSEFTVVPTINGDAKQWTQDPSEAQPVNAQYATRQDTATFTVTNTGSGTKKNLVLTYDIATPVSAIDQQGREISTMVHQSVQNKVGTLNPGDYTDVNVKSPVFAAMATANLTISATWDGGSMDLYKTDLTPTFQSGTSYTPANQLSVKMSGSYT